jgi:spermidine/putrescine transport system permease protein
MRPLLRGYVAAAFLFLYLPLVVLSVFSFNDSRFTLWNGFSVRWYRAAWENPQLTRAASTSLIIAVCSTLFATVAGTLCAYGLWKRNTRPLTTALYLSLVTPEIVMGVALLSFYQIVLGPMGASLGMHTVILSHILFSLAYVVLVVLARLRTLDPRLEEAALDLGANEWQAFRRVTLPLLLPGIAAAALLAFTISFDDYVITSLVAGVDSETLPMVVYAMARRGVHPEVNAVCAVIVVLLGSLILVTERLNRT